MSTDLEIRRTDVPATFADQMHMARVLADSSLLPSHLRGKPANVLVILQGARALDVAAFWALQSMHVIDGKLGMAAELMRALVTRAGHRIRVVERTAKRAVVEIQRCDRDTPYVAEFTWEDATAAKLVTRENWLKYPKSMLVARATSIAVRDECPDVLFGVVYTPDELGSITDDEGRPMADGEVVEPLTAEEIDEIVDGLGVATLEDLPALWARVTDRAGQFVKAREGSDETLFDVLTQRLSIEAVTANHKGDARRLWNLAATLRLGEATVTVNGQQWDLKALLRHVGATLPDEPEPEVESDSAETEHARQMQAAAAASWEEAIEATEVIGEPVIVEGKEYGWDDLKNKIAEEREAVFDRLKRAQERNARIRDAEEVDPL